MKNQEELKIMSKTIASVEHTEKVHKLTISDILQMNNENVIPTDIVDKLYYHLLDSNKVREELRDETWWYKQCYL